MGKFSGRRGDDNFSPWVADYKRLLETLPGVMIHMSGDLHDMLKAQLRSSDSAH